MLDTSAPTDSRPAVVIVEGRALADPDRDFGGGGAWGFGAFGVRWSLHGRRLNLSRRSGKAAGWRDCGFEGSRNREVVAGRARG